VYTNLNVFRSTESVVLAISWKGVAISDVVGVCL